MTLLNTEGYYRRALVLHEQHRHADAVQELRQALAQEPSHAGAHALLAMCLAELKQYEAATDEANAAIGLSPDLPFGHYARAYVMLMRERYEEALESIDQAIGLNAYNPAFFGLKSSIFFGLRRWPAALEAAESGLEIDPENARCVNLRAMALVKLGRKAEAGAAIDAALKRDPEDAVTHANQGWTLMHQGQHKKAMEHFREALRLNPEMDWARAGIVEALKARNPIYRVMLAYFLWMNRLSRQAQWGIIIGGYVGYRIVLGINKTGTMGLILWALVIAYIAFALMTWLADPLFNLMLRLDRFGRYALSARQKMGANSVGLVLLAAIGCAVAFAVTLKAALLLGAIGLVLLLVPTSAIFKVTGGWPQTVMVAYAAILLCLLAAIVLGFWHIDLQSYVADWLQKAINVFVWGVFLHGWIANILIGLRVRR